MRPVLDWGGKFCRCSSKVASEIAELSEKKLSEYYSVQGSMGVRENQLVRCLLLQYVD